MNLKKIFASVLSAAMIASSITISAFAAESPKLVVSKDTTVRGDYFTVSLDITEATTAEIGSASVTLGYDNAAFKFEGATAGIGDLVYNDNTTDVKFSVNDMSLSRKTGKLFTAKFSVKNDAGGGSYDFNVSDYFVADENGDKLLESATSPIDKATVKVTAPTALEVTGLTIDEQNKKATWDSTPNASDYTVTVEYGGKSIYTGNQATTELSFGNLIKATGDYTVKVIANSNNSLYITSGEAIANKKFVVNSTISINEKEYVAGSNGFDVVLTLNGNTLDKISDDAKELVSGTDYTYSDATKVVHLDDEYLKTITGNKKLTFTFSDGAAAELNITVAKAADGATLIFAEREIADKTYIDASGNDIDTNENDGTEDGAIVIASNDGPITKFIAAQFSMSNDAETGFDTANYEIVPADGFALLYDENTQLYEINVKPVNGVRPDINSDGANKGIVIGKIVYKGGYGKGKINLSSAVMTTEKSDNTYKKQDIGTFSFSYNIPEPAANLTVNVNLAKLPTKVDNVKAYQNMKLRVYSARLGFIDFELGTDAVKYEEKNGTLTTTGEVTQSTNTYTLKLENLPKYDKYTVFISGDGYREAKVQLDLNENTTVDFWNNANDSELAQVTKETSGIEKQSSKNFLAGDIIMNGVIDLYDLSAVSSYYGKSGLTAGDKDYIQYDLNRDGKVDIIDITMLLAGWAE